MKLWWVHLEAMVASLMAFQHTNSQQHWENFVKIFKYSFEKVEPHFISLKSRYLVTSLLYHSSLCLVESGPDTWTDREGSRWTSREDLTRDASTCPELFSSVRIFSNKSLIKARPGHLTLSDCLDFNCSLLPQLPQSCCVS